MSLEASGSITLRALVTARWVLIGLLAATGVAVALAPDRAASFISWFPSRPQPFGFVTVLVVWSAINVATARWGVHADAHGTLAGAHLAIDTTVLTVLLALSGGATNPFTTVYFVPITLATQVSPRWTWSLAGYSLLCFAALFVLQPIPVGPPGHEAHFAGHLRGMWVAFGVSGVLITVFVHRIALSLARQRDELAQLREEAMADRHLASLGSLAAGAAHELGTPLGTVQLLVAELPHMNAQEQADAIASAKREIGRCKTIVHRMTSPELSMHTLRAGGAEPWPLHELLADLQAELPGGTERGDDVIAVHVQAGARGESTQPKEVLRQILRELVSNARDACRSAGRGEVQVNAATVGDDVRITVKDDADGMPAEVAAKAMNPFFTTKVQGDGMGLGLYLARAQLRQLGGTLLLQPNPDRGTSVLMCLPLHPPLDPRGRA